MRILTMANVPPNPNSGAAGTVYWTNQALRQLGHQVDEIWDDQLPRNIAHGNLHALLEQPRRYRSTLQRRLAHQRYDVVQVSQPQAWLAARWFQRSRQPGLFINRSHGVETHVDQVVPAWQQHYGQQPGPLKQALQNLMRARLARQWPQVLRHATGVITGCNNDRQFLLQRYKINPATVAAIHHGVHPQFLDNPAPASTPNRLRHILYVGQFAFIKGPQVVAATINQLAEADPELHFTWVCAADDHPRVRELLRHPARVALEPWQPQPDLIRLYDTHGLFLFGSFFEGCGKAPMEAMARGAIPISTRVGGMAEFIHDGHNGFLVEPNDHQTLAERALHLIAHPDQAAALSTAARRSAESLRWQDCAQHSLDFYQELIQRLGKKV